MFGKEDEDILNYFIRTAFPTEQETEKIVNYIGEYDGVREGQIIAALNMRNTRIKKALSFLIPDGHLLFVGTD